MNGRVYDPTTARFLSADPNIFHPFDTQNFNRYTYVMNNPLKYTDPSGFDFFGTDDDGSTWGDWDNDFDANGDWNGMDGGEMTGDENGDHTTQNIIDNRGNVIGNVTYDQRGNYDVSYKDNSGFGYSNNTNYSHDDKGQFTTHNTVTGDKIAGWDTGSYKSVEVMGRELSFFTDSKINYHSISYGELTVNNISLAHGLRNGAMVLDKVVAALIGMPTLQTKAMALNLGIASTLAKALAEGLDPSDPTASVMNGLLDVIGNVIGNPAIDFAVDIFKGYVDYTAKDRGDIE